MLRAVFISLLTLPLLHSADEFVKPDKLTLHTWVREDMFAGWIGNDTPTLERGVKKIDRFLADHPGDINALAWKYLASSYYMIRARAKGDDAAYAKHMAEAKDLRAKIFAGDFQDVGPYIIVGSGLINTACYAPEKERAAMFRDGRQLLAKVPELQGKLFDDLAPHMRGELWFELAFASDRLGDTEARDRTLQTIITHLAGTPYETRAREWQKPGKIAGEKQYNCISCHEPGRLAPTLARINGTANAR